MNILTLFEQTIVRALVAGCVEKTGVPHKGNDDCSAVEQPNNELVVGG
jgi:hypothetical protein